MRGPIIKSRLILNGENPAIISTADRQPLNAHLHLNGFQCTSVSICSPGYRLSISASATCLSGFWFKSASISLLFFRAYILNMELGRLEGTVSIGRSRGGVVSTVVPLEDPEMRPGHLPRRGIPSSVFQNFSWMRTQWLPLDSHHTGTCRSARDARCVHLYLHNFGSLR